MINAMNKNLRNTILPLAGLAMMASATQAVAKNGKGVEKTESRNKAALQLGKAKGSKKNTQVFTNASDVYGASLCNGWEQIQLGDFIVENNIWGAGDARTTDWLQCVEVLPTATGESVSWGWDWPVGGGLVKGYPSVIYGDKFGMTSASKKTTGLPTKVGNIDEYIINFDFDETAPNGARNIALESWMHTTKKAAIENVGVEMMVWLDKTEAFNTWGTHLWDVEIDGVVFELYQTDEPGWSYIAFVAKERFTGNSLRWNSFVEHIIETGLADKNLYMANIEFGTELVSGTGDFTLNHYSIDRKKR